MHFLTCLQPTLILIYSIETREKILLNHLEERKKKKSFWSQVKSTVTGKRPSASALVVPAANLEEKTTLKPNEEDPSRLSQSSKNTSPSSTNPTFDRPPKSPDRFAVPLDRRESVGYEERSPMWFIVHISNRNTSMKSLYRYLSLLKSSLSSSGPRFVHDFVGALVPHIGVRISRYSHLVD